MTTQPPSLSTLARSGPATDAFLRLLDRFDVFDRFDALGFLDDMRLGTNPEKGPFREGSWHPLAPVHAEIAGLCRAYEEETRDERRNAGAATAWDALAGIRLADAMPPAPPARMQGLGVMDRRKAALDRKAARLVAADPFVAGLDLLRMHDREDLGLAEIRTRSGAAPEVCRTILDAAALAMTESLGHGIYRWRSRDRRRYPRTTSARTEFVAAFDADFGRLDVLDRLGMILDAAPLRQAAWTRARFGLDGSGRRSLASLSRMSEFGGFMRSSDREDVDRNLGSGLLAGLAQEWADARFDEVVDILDDEDAWSRKDVDAASFFFAEVIAKRPYGPMWTAFDRAAEDGRRRPSLADWRDALAHHSEDGHRVMALGSLR